MIAKAPQQQHAPRLGEGAYSLAEAARYTQLRYGRVRAWFRGRGDGEGAGVMLPGDFKEIGDDFAVSFLDMIDALVAGQFRAQGVPLHTVRRAHAILQSELATFCIRSAMSTSTPTVGESSASRGIINQPMQDNPSTNIEQQKPPKSTMSPLLSNVPFSVPLAPSPPGRGLG